MRVPETRSPNAQCSVTFCHQTETRELHERLRLEREAWEENYMKKKETWLAQRERELKEAVRRERDQEIDLVIRRLEEDATATRDECQQTADNKIRYEWLKVGEMNHGEVREINSKQNQVGVTEGGRNESKWSERYQLKTKSGRSDWRWENQGEVRETNSKQNQVGMTEGGRNESRWSERNQLKTKSGRSDWRWEKWIKVKWEKSTQKKSGRNDWRWEKWIKVKWEKSTKNKIR